MAIVGGSSRESNYGRGGLNPPDLTSSTTATFRRQADRILARWDHLRKSCVNVNFVTHAIASRDGGHEKQRVFTMEVAVPLSKKDFCQNFRIVLSIHPQWQSDKRERHKRIYRRQRLQSRNQDKRENRKKGWSPPTCYTIT